MNKQDFLKGSKKYDKKYASLVQKEKEIGSRLRKSKMLTLEDLAFMVEWKFQERQAKKNKIFELIMKNKNENLAEISNQIFNIPENQDAFRIESLITLQGVSPVLASVILSFFDPKQYGVFSLEVWRVIFGNEPANLFTKSNYLKLLEVFRRKAGKFNLDVRLIEKGYFMYSKEKK